MKGLNENLARVMQRLILPALLESLNRSSCICDGDLFTLQGLSGLELGMCHISLHNVALAARACFDVQRHQQQTHVRQMLLNAWLEFLPLDPTQTV